MIGNAAFGTLGLIAQLAIFALVLLSAAPRRGVLLASVMAGVAAIYGYALAVSFGALFAVPWQTLNVGASLCVGLIAMSRRARDRLRVGAMQVLLALRRSWLAVTVLSAIGAFALLVAALEAEPSIDGQLYHGPVLALLVQTGSLWGWPVPNEYMYYTDLTMAGGVNLATFAGDARFDNAIQVPHLLLLVAVVAWALQSRIRLADTRVAIAAVIVTSPVVWLQPRILYVDLAYGTAVAISVLMIALTTRYRYADVVVLGIAISAVFAGKPTGAFTGSVLLAAALLAMVISSGGLRLGTTWRAAGALALAGLLPPLVAGTSFYVRNFIAFQNPLYPVAVDAGPVAFPGLIDLSLFASGERGSGLVDPGRWASYAGGLLDGAIHGTTKLDYDPRSGGFGRLPLVLLAIAVALLLARAVSRLRAAGESARDIAGWRASAVSAALAAVILAIQPSTFDSRYVIGPTVVLAVAVLRLVSVPARRWFEVLIALVALLAAVAQASWVERHMYAGLREILTVMHGPVEWYPVTPASPGGRQGALVGWLPEECTSIAVQSAGGVTPAGLAETSRMAALSYGLYGDQLCNSVRPVVAGDGVDDAPTLIGSRFIVLFEGSLDDWLADTPSLEGCLLEVDSLDGAGDFPQASDVYLNTCSG